MSFSNRPHPVQLTLQDINNHVVPKFISMRSRIRLMHEQSTHDAASQLVLINQFKL